MTIDGLFPTKHVIQDNMFWSRTQPFFATKHVRDFHKMIVHNNSEMVCRKPISFHEYLIINQFIFERNIVTHKICPRGSSFVRHVKTNNMWRVRVKFFLNVFCWKCFTVPIVASWLFIHFLHFSEIIETFFGTKTIIRIFLLKQLMNILFVNIQAFWLNIRSFFPYLCQMLMCVKRNTFIRWDMGPM